MVARLWSGLVNQIINSYKILFMFSCPIIFSAPLSKSAAVNSIHRQSLDKISGSSQRNIHTTLVESEHSLSRKLI